MRRLFSALALLLFFSLGGSPRAEVAPPADAKEPVRLTLEECIKMGLENNPQVGISQAQVDQAEGQVMQAKANQYPSVKLSGNYVRSNKLPEFATGAPTYFFTGPSQATPSIPSLPMHWHQIGFPGFEMSSTREGDIYGVKVEALYALYTGGKIKNGIAAAELNKKSAEETVRQNKSELEFNIVQAFYGLILAQEMVKVVDDGLATAQAHLRQVKALYNEGIVSNLDVLKVEAMIAEIKPMQIQARNGVKMAQLGLNNMLNIDLDTPVEAVGKLEYKPFELPLPEDLYAEALSYRPEMRIIDLRGQMAKKMLEIARTNAYPTVGLFANYSWDRGQDMPPNDKVWRDGYQAGLGMSVPLYDGNATKGKVMEAEAILKQVEQGKRALDLGIRTQVQQAILSLKAAEEKVAAEKVNVNAARKNYEAASTRYSAGLASNLDVMDSQTKLTRAKADYLQSVYDYNLARAQLEAAIGNIEAVKEGKRP